MKKDLGNNDIILLIDGNALLHRAFHGMPELKTKQGVLVNAVYGFTSAMLAAIKEFDPKYIIVAWDVGKKTFRTDKYDKYKATRKQAPQELYDQFPIAKEVCKALNIPQFGIDNYEADDVIGTIADQISHKNVILKSKVKSSDVGNLANRSLILNSIQVEDDNSKNQKTDNYKLKTVIVTGDMDALQLVNNDTEVYSISRGIKKAVLFDEAAVKEKYGFRPQQLIDYKALRGDPSDNIPGVPGVGDKTATSLVSQFGSIDKLYQALELDQVPADYKLSSRIKQQLVKYKGQAYLSKELATICKETPLNFELADAIVHDYNLNVVKELFAELQFKSLYKRLPKSNQEQVQGQLF